MTQKNRSNLSTEITTNINDNTTGDISAADVRGALQDIADSCFNILSDGNVVSSVNGDASISVDSTDPSNPIVALDVTNQNTWTAQQTFNAAAPIIGTGTANTAVYLDSSKQITSSAVTNTELGYVSGVTSAIQTQLSNKQNLDATLTALSGFNTNGILTQTAADTFTGRTISGTSNRVTVTNGDGVSANPAIDISSSYVGQNSITTLGTIGTGTWNGAKVSEIYGGTNQSTYTLGDIIYSSATNTLSKLSGNTTATKQYLSQTGTGTISAAPSWAAIGGADVTGAALTSSNDTNVTISLGGNATTALLRSASLTMGWTGILGLSRGGTGVSSFSGGTNGVVYYNGTNLVNTSGGPSGQVLHGNGSGAPSFSNIISSDFGSNILDQAHGGTSFSSYTLGDVIYAGTSGVLAKLSGNTTSTKKFLTQTGTGTVSAAPSWATISSSDITGAALTKTNDTNVTLTLGGSATTALLNAASLTLGWTGLLAGTRGGTGVSNSGNLTYGANNLTFTTSGTTSLTLPTSGTVLTSTTGVSSITGTSNQVIASASTGAVTLSLPQDIGTASAVQFGNIGVGVTPVANVLGYFAGTVGGATSADAMYLNATFASAVTNVGYTFECQPRTAAASFTMSQCYAFYARGVILGAGSAVTTQAGFFADDGITTATNNRGFQGNIAAATGRWNLYMSGTAQNSITGLTALGPDTTVPTALCDVSASSTARASVRIRSGTAPTSPNDGDMWYDGTNLKFRVGGTTKTVTLT